MPKNKEELYGLLYEFDSQVRAVAKAVDEYVECNECDVSALERGCIRIYVHRLNDVVDWYDRFEKHLARYIQRGEA